MGRAKMSCYAGIFSLLALGANAQTTDPPTAAQSVKPEQVFGEWQGLSRACERMSMVITTKGLNNPGFDGRNRCSRAFFKYRILPSRGPGKIAFYAEPNPLLDECFGNLHVFELRTFEDNQDAATFSAWTDSDVYLSGKSVDGFICAFGRNLGPH